MRCHETPCVVRLGVSAPREKSASKLRAAPSSAAICSGIARSTERWSDPFSSSPAARACAACGESHVGSHPTRQLRAKLRECTHGVAAAGTPTTRLPTGRDGHVTARCLEQRAPKRRTPSHTATPHTCSFTYCYASHLLLVHRPWRVRDVRREAELPGRLGKVHRRHRRAPRVRDVVPDLTKQCRYTWGET